MLHCLCYKYTSLRPIRDQIRDKNVTNTRPIRISYWEQNCLLQIDEPAKNTRANTDVADNISDVLRDSFLFFGLNMLTLLGADPQVATQDLLDMYNLHNAITNVSIFIYVQRTYSNN